jgi:nucleoside-diphosphate-sugar epimerase
MRIFLTGSTGVIGRRVIPQLIEAGHEVTAGAGKAAEAAGAALTGASSYLSTFRLRGRETGMAGQDAVINLATHVPPGLRAFLPGAWRENDRIRTAGSALLVNAALASDVQLFIQESFITYPDSADRWIDEDTPPGPSRLQSAPCSMPRILRPGSPGRGDGPGAALRLLLRLGRRLHADDAQECATGLVADLRQA